MQITSCTNISFVTYKEKPFLGEHSPYRPIEIPNEVIQMLRKDREQRIQPIFFSGKHDAFLWASMAGGDNFRSFLTETQLLKKPVLIIVDRFTKKLLEKSFRQAGFIISEYGRTGKQPSSLCKIIYEGQNRHIQVIERHLLN